MSFDKDIKNIMEQRGSVNLALTVGMIGRGKDSQQRQDGVEYVVKKLCQHIRGVVTGDEWRKYEASKLDPSRIELFLDRKEIKSCVQKYLKLHPSHKDKTKAMILKNAANKAFGSGDNSGALHLYTQCLALMPHGTKGKYTQSSLFMTPISFSESPLHRCHPHFSLTTLDAYHHFSLIFTYAYTHIYMHMYVCMYGRALNSNSIGNGSIN